MASSHLIADTYKLLHEIGAGGGGIVYLGEHTRLGKQVVLKADKRTISASAEVLRREVDALKNLSHTYIPQVYDFVVENETVYTVMDFIDGESFDKPLKRGERFSQAQVVEWACQLLEAVSYLHSRPPHGILHADIKPSNIMLTPQGDILLIDYNIALALNEEGAVVAGRSFGYASPEHYGIDYASGGEQRTVHTDTPANLSPETVVESFETVVESAETVVESAETVAISAETVQEPAPVSVSASTSTSSKKTIVLDVRSDIYGLGATLYHFLTGERPAQDATQVKPISAKEFSPAIIEIITKSMNPNRDLRWQTAEEMLHAFRNLHANDPRTKKLKRTSVVAGVVLAVFLFAGIAAIFVGQRLMAEEQRLAAQLNEARVLVEYSATALRGGDVDSAVRYALQSLSNVHTADGRLALTNALGVYDFFDGFKNHRILELPASPLHMAISPDGKTAAVVYSFAVAVFCTESAEILATLPALHSALAEVYFLNGNVIIFAGEAGITAFDFTSGVVMWTGGRATSIKIAADGGSVAAIYRDEDFATVYDALSGEILHEVSFGGRHQRVAVNDIFANPQRDLFAINRDGSLQ